VGAAEDGAAVATEALAEAVGDGEVVALGLNEPVGEGLAGADGLADAVALADGDADGLGDELSRGETDAVGDAEGVGIGSANATVLDDSHSAAAASVVMKQRDAMLRPPESVTRVTSTRRHSHQSSGSGWTRTRVRRSH